MNIYTLTSALHDEQSVSKTTLEFLDSLDIEYDLKGADYTDYGSAPLSLIFVRTGGTEGLFLQLFDDLRRRSSHPFYLLSSGKSNSLAASMEILAFLRQQDVEGEILHGPAEYVSQRIKTLERVGQARQTLHGKRLGIVGQPSDWLIASQADKEKVRQHLGIELIDIPMQELVDVLRSLEVQELRSSDDSLRSDGVKECGCEDDNPLIINLKSQTSNIKPLKIYSALKAIVGKYCLSGLTLRCFDLLTTVKSTGCLALALLNSEGTVAGCEGDVPAMLSMAVAQALTGCTGFQANPAQIAPVTGRMLFAHCTIPLNMVERYELDTHFESGIGVGIRGYMKPRPVTIFKLAGDLSRAFIAEGQLVECQAKPDLCRTQMLIQLDEPSLTTSYFLQQPIGNHHIILPGHHAEILHSFIPNQ